MEDLYRFMWSFKRPIWEHFSTFRKTDVSKQAYTILRCAFKKSARKDEGDHRKMKDTLLGVRTNEICHIHIQH